MIQGRTLFKCAIYSSYNFSWLFTCTGWTLIMWTERSPYSEVVMKLMTKSFYFQYPMTFFHQKNLFVFKISTPSSHGSPESGFRILATCPSPIYILNVDKTIKFFTTYQPLLVHVAFEWPQNLMLKYHKISIKLWKFEKKCFKVHFNLIHFCVHIIKVHPVDFLVVLQIGSSYFWVKW